MLLSDLLFCDQYGTVSRSDRLSQTNSFILIRIIFFENTINLLYLLIPSVTSRLLVLSLKLGLRLERTHVVLQEENVVVKIFYFLSHRPSVHKLGNHHTLQVSVALFSGSISYTGKMIVRRYNECESDWSHNNNSEKI